MRASTHASRTRPVSQLFSARPPVQSPTIPAAELGFEIDLVTSIVEESRAHELAALDDWFKNNDHRRPLVVVGKPGVGKTTLLATAVKLYASRGQLACAYAFDSLDCRRTGLDEAMRSLSKQCGVKEQPKTTKEGQLDIESSFSAIMASLPVSLDTEHRLIVLDALDECEDADRLYALVAGLRSRAPRQVHLLCSISQRCRERLSDVLWLEMKMNGGHQQEAVKSVLREPLTSVCERIDLATCLELLVRQTKGNMVCAKAFQNQLKVMSTDGKRLALREVKNSFTNGLGEHLNTLFSDLQAILEIAMEGRDNSVAVDGEGGVYTRVLAGLVLARRPLRLTDEFSVLLKDDSLDVLALFAELASVVSLTAGLVGSGVSVRHTAIREWLVDDTLSGTLGLRKAAGQRVMADTCLDACLGMTSTDTPCGMSEYAVEYGVWHAVQCEAEKGVTDSTGDHAHSPAERMARVAVTPEYRRVKLSQCGQTAYMQDLEELLADRSVTSDTRKALKQCKGESRCYFTELTRAPRTTDCCRVSSFPGETVLAVEVGVDDNQPLVFTLTRVCTDGDIVLKVYDGDMKRQGDEVTVNTIPGYMSTSPGGLVHPVLCPVQGACVFVGSYSHFADPLNGHLNSGVRAMEMVTPPAPAQDSGASGFSVETAAYICNTSNLTNTTTSGYLVTALNGLTHGGRCLRVVVHRLDDASLLADVEVVRFRFGGSVSFGVRCCAVRLLPPQAGGVDDEQSRCLEVAACVKHTGKQGAAVYTFTTGVNLDTSVPRLCGELPSDSYSRCEYLDERTLMLTGRLQSATCDNVNGAAKTTVKKPVDENALLWMTDISDARPLQHRRAALLAPKSNIAPNSTASSPSDNGVSPGDGRDTSDTLLVLADTATSAGRTILACLDNQCLDGASTPIRYRVQGAPQPLQDLMCMGSKVNNV